MRIVGNKNGYTLHLTGRETEAWANDPTKSWPCSKLSGRKLRVIVDRGGLLDINRQSVDLEGAEVDACVADHLPTEFRHLWPAWETLTQKS